MTAIEAQLIYALAWASFGLGHSVLARERIKTPLAPILGPYYRISYNVLASVHIVAVWLVGAWVFADISSFSPPGFVRAGQDVLYLAGIVVFLLALGQYDLGLLSGITQIRGTRSGKEPAGEEPIHTGGLHAYVRHPIYAGAYLLLWGNARDEFGLATAVWGSIYLAIGTMFEERHLLTLYGTDYQSYRRKVPAILPWRGKAL